MFHRNLSFEFKQLIFKEHFDETLRQWSEGIAEGATREREARRLAQAVAKCI